MFASVPARPDLGCIADFWSRCSVVKEPLLPTTAYRAAARRANQPALSADTKLGHCYVPRSHCSVVFVAAPLVCGPAASAYTPTRLDSEHYTIGGRQSKHPSPLGGDESPRFLRRFRYPDTRGGDDQRSLRPRPHHDRSVTEEQPVVTALYSKSLG